MDGINALTPETSASLSDARHRLAGLRKVLCAAGTGPLDFWRQYGSLVMRSDRVVMSTSVTILYLRFCNKNASLVLFDNFSIESLHTSVHFSNQFEIKYGAIFLNERGCDTSRHLQAGKFLQAASSTFMLHRSIKNTFFFVSDCLAICWSRSRSRTLHHALAGYSLIECHSRRFPPVVTCRLSIPAE